MPKFFMKINHNVSPSPTCNINEFSPTTNKTMSSNCFSRSILYQTITTNTIKMPHCFFTSTKPAGSSPRLPYSSESQLPTSSLCKANRINLMHSGSFFVQGHQAEGLDLNGLASTNNTMVYRTLAAMVNQIYNSKNSGINSRKEYLSLVSN